MNRTIFTGDNLDILRGFNDECIDLVYLDPPFNSGTDYSAPIGSDAAGTGFKDTWNLQDVDVAWLDLIRSKHSGIGMLIDAAILPSCKSYLIYMAVRLLQVRRVLKPTGSVYLHCDPAMSHPLKMMMDVIWGHGNFRNEIVWRRSVAHNDPRRYGNNTDRLLFYTCSDEYTWNGDDIATEKTEEELKLAYPGKDDRGRYRSSDLTGQGASSGESGRPWKNYDVSSRGRHWSVPLTGRYAAWIDENIISGYLGLQGPHARLDALDESGMIHHPARKGGWPGLKRYRQADAGSPVQALFTDIDGFTNYNKRRSKEYVGYPTQKPLALLERIIRASSNPGDMVLDPFCGCATTCVAAENLGRGWIGIDVSAKAAELVLRRLDRCGWTLFNLFTHRTDIPRRTDLGRLPRYNCRENRERLYGEQGGYCAGCGDHFQPRNLTVDHIIGTSVGGTDHIDNLQLLCAHCNSVKGGRGMEYLISALNRSPRVAISPRR